MLESLAANTENLQTSLYVLPDRLIACLLQLVEILNRYKSTKVVVIADECGINEQFKATQIAGHLKGRLRIVAIDNSEIPPGRAGVIALERVEDGHLREILAINFPGVPSESRDHYAAIAGGYIRFAADLCRQHPRIVADGHFGRASFSIRQYLSFRLGGRLETLAALSLVLKVGYLGEEAEELRDLAEFVRRDHDELVSDALSMKNSPGFVVEAGRYLYVTPEIVANVAFEKAWETWFSGDLSSKLSAFPSSLLPSLEARISRSALQSAQEATSIFFSSWVVGLDPQDLQDRSTLVRFVKLIEMNPETFLPILVAKLRSSPSEVLNRLGGVDQYGRRLIVHQMERALAFPNLFSLVTEVLFVLSLEESEGWANNSTRIFEQSFSIINSGSSLPFSERLGVLCDLVSRYSAYQERFARLLPELLNFQRVRHVSEPYLGRRLAPPLWEPKDAEELAACASDLIKRCLSDEVLCQLPRETLLAGVAQHTRQLLGLGLYREVFNVLEAGVTFDTVVDRIDSGVKSFREHDLRQAEKLPVGIENIVEALMPKSSDEWLRKAIRAKYWTLMERGENSELMAVINQCAENTVHKGQIPALILENLGKTTEPTGIVVFSEILGKLDTGLSLLDQVLESSLTNSDFMFLGAYLRSISPLPEDVADTVLSVLDPRLQEQPIQISQVIASARQNLNATDFLVGRIKDRRVPIWVVSTFIYDQEISGSDLALAFSAVLDHLLEESASGVTQATRAALSEIARGVRYVLFSKGEEGRLSGAVKRQLVKLIDWSISVGFAPEDFPAIVAHLVEFEGVQWAVDRLTIYLSLKDYQLAEAAEEAFVTLANDYTIEILNSIDSKVRKERNLYLEIHPRRKLFEALQTSQVLGWVQQDKEARRWVARHLPGPKEVEGEVVLPDVTRELIELYAGDEHFGDSVVAGIESMRVSVGSLSQSRIRRAALYEQVASKYDGAVKEWAREQALSLRQQAERWRIREDEENSPQDL